MHIALLSIWSVRFLFSRPRLELSMLFAMLDFFCPLFSCELRDYKMFRKSNRFFLFLSIFRNRQLIRNFIFASQKPFFHIIDTLFRCVTLAQKKNRNNRLWQKTSVHDKNVLKLVLWPQYNRAIILILPFFSSQRWRNTRLFIFCFEITRGQGTESHEREERLFYSVSLLPFFFLLGLEFESREITHWTERNEMAQKRLVHKLLVYAYVICSPGNLFSFQLLFFLDYRID